MIDQIKQIIEQVSAQEGNKGLPTDLTKQITEETGNSIVSGLKAAASSGNISQITDLFQGGGSSLTSNPLVAGMITNLVGSLTGKLGLDQGTSSNFASSVVPKVLESLVGQSKDGSLDIQELLGTLTGGSGGLEGMLGGLAGGLLNKDKSSEGGGALDGLKGLFK